MFICDPESCSPFLRIVHKECLLHNVDQSAVCHFYAGLDMIRYGLLYSSNTCTTVGIDTVEVCVLTVYTDWL